MRLTLTLVAASGTVEDLLVTAGPGATVGQLATAIAARDPAAARAPQGGVYTLMRLGPAGAGEQGWALLPAAARLGEEMLASGSSIALAVGPARDPRASPMVRLEVLGGPTAGRSYDLAAGSWLLGRDPGCDLVIDDPMVSARHARLELGEVSELVDLGSANGVIVDGEPVANVRIDGELQFVLGGSVLRAHRLAEVATATREDATVRFTRSPRLEPRYPGEQFTAPTTPVEPERDPFPWLLTLAPLLLGVALAVVLERPSALLFAVATPLMLLGGFLTQRGRRRRRYRRAIEDYERRLAVLEPALEHAASTERAARLAEAPSTLELLEAVADRSPLLWSRRPEHWNFLSVRLGTTALASRTSIATPGRDELLPELRDRLDALCERHRVLGGLPIVERLVDAGAIGLAGAPEHLGPVLDGVLAQLSCLHAPTELVVAAVVSSSWAARLDWLKWLPHSSSSQSPIDGISHLADTSIAAAALLDAIEELVRRRTASTGRATSRGPIARSSSALETSAAPEAAARHGPGSGGEVPLPAVVLVISGDAPAARARLIALSEVGPDAGVFPIWVAAAHAELPAACRSTVDVTDSATGAVRLIRIGEAFAPVRVDAITPVAAQTMGRSLAPLVDAGASPVEARGVPSLVHIGSLLGPGMLDDPRAVVDRWREHGSILERAAPSARAAAPASGLPAIIGRAAEGPVRLDLRAHGPHALVAGTTGAGKSEFLRSWVLSLAAEHSPDRVNFLFVDYKGGSAFAECVGLPHCVGLVTDLGPRLVRRALISLRAEVQHRERLFARLRVSELTELEARGDPSTPPALILVVDEFAALAKEVPEFVDGVLDLAQRGRALGMHLVLATQRPAGVIKEGIKANTNLRIALRMAEAADSLDVLGVADAAALDPSLPGRAMVRTGPGRPLLLQTAYTGGRGGQALLAPDLIVGPLGFGGGQRRSHGETIATSQVAALTVATDLQRLVATISVAAELAEIRAPRRPWLDELPSLIGLGDLLTGDDAVIPFGLSDVPGQQRRELAAFRPDAEGHLAIIGASGAGKSSALRTLAIATAVTTRGGPVEVYGLDFASGGLRVLEALPHVGSIVPGDDVERVHRLLRRLGAMLADRTSRFSEANARNLTEYRESEVRAVEPRVLLLIDAFPVFREEWEGRPSRAVAYETFREVLATGRSLGIHVALSADRAAALPSGVAAAVQRRVLLRSAGEAGAVPVVPPEGWPPGRGVVDGLETQIAILGAGAAGVQSGEDSRVIADFARTHADVIPCTEPIRSLPRRISPSDLPAQVAGRPVLGLAEESLAPIGFDPAGTFLLAGPAASGRTNALAWMARALRAAVPTLRIVHFGPQDSALSTIEAFDRSVTDVRSVEATARALLEELAADRPPRVAIIIESLAGYLGTAAEPHLAALPRQLRRGGGLLVAEEEIAGWTGISPLLSELKAARRGLLLQPEVGDGEVLLRFALPRGSRAVNTPGRGLLVDQGRGAVVQLPHTLA